MQDHRSRASEQSTRLTAQVIVETLKVTKPGRPINLKEIATSARTRSGDVLRILEDSIDTERISDGDEIGPSNRFKLALKAARLGAIQEVARALTWQEFETFCEECLALAGFQTKKGVILKEETRSWQIDVVARKSQMILAVDCKHWDSPNYPSKFIKAAEHQKLALRALMGRTRSGQGATNRNEWGLPIILTLFDPRSSISHDVVLVSVAQLSDFLSQITPYDAELPFVS